MNRVGLKIKVIACGLVMWMSMVGCVVYHPQMTDIPLISEKHDLRVDAGVSVVPSAYTTLSYGLTDKIAIQGFGSVGPDERYYLQGAAGLYKKNSNNRVVEVYGGFGSGYGNLYRDSHPGHLEWDYKLYFGQLNYGKIASAGSGLEIGIGLKTGYIHSGMTDRSYRLYEDAIPDPQFMTDVANRGKGLLAEPVGMIRMGRGRLKLSVKVGSTWIYQFTNDRRLPYSRFNAGVGVNYRL